MYVFKKILNVGSNASSRLWNALKFLFPRFIGFTNVYFLRKTNTFIKSKYSKNRQWSKSIVYFGLWFGVISAFTLTYYNYRFLFSISYLWWPVATLALALVLTGFRRYKSTYCLFLLNFIM